MNRPKVICTVGRQRIRGNINLGIGTVQKSPAHIASGGRKRLHQNPRQGTATGEGTALTYIPAPYTVDAEIAGPKEYLEPKFYVNGEGEPTIGVTYVGVIVEDGKYFKDSDNDKELDIFEDWRLDDETRAKDLLTKLTNAQKISMQQVQMVLPPTATTYSDALDANGKVDLSKLMVISDKVLGVAEDDPSRVNNSTAEIISFGNRMGVIRTITDIKTGALYNNATNMTAEYAAVAKNEASIPFTIIANPQYVMGEPITVGIAAAVMGDVAAGGDYNAIERYASLDRQIWRAKGIDRMYGQQIDLITDPRWIRNLTAFTEDPTVLANIATALVKGYQGSTEGLQDDGIAMIMKHFPGDSASYNGLESHSGAGQLRMYMVEGSLEKYFLPAFQAAVDAKVAGIMPCYSRPALINAKQTYRGVDINPASLGSAYNSTILQTLLRDLNGGFTDAERLRRQEEERRRKEEEDRLRKEAEEARKKPRKTASERKNRSGMPSDPLDHWNHDRCGFRLECRQQSAQWRVGKCQFLVQWGNQYTTYT